MGSEIKNQITPLPELQDLSPADREPLDSAALNPIITDNTFMLNILDGITIGVLFTYDSTSSNKRRELAATWGGTNYETVDSLYSFFKENGLTVQEEQK